MKTVVAILLLSCGALAQDKAAIAAAEAACGPHNVKFEVQVDASHHPTPTPENGKALIYVVQDGGFTSGFGIDGKWVGANHGRSYFFVQIDPGEHHLCTMDANGIRTPAFLHQLKAEAGMTYYFFSHVYTGRQLVPELGLSQLDPDEGKDLVARAKFCTSHPK